MKKLLKTRLLAGVIIVATFALFTQCNEQMAQEEQSGLKFGVSGGGSGFDAVAYKNGFQNNVHPLLRDSKYGCVNCHGSFQSPMHGHPDVDVALDEIERSNLINFDNPAASRIIDKVGVERHNCADKCAELAANLEIMITEWVDASGASGNTGGGGQTGGNSGGGNSGGSPGDYGDLFQTTFEDTVHPVLRDSKYGCVNCHGVSQVPMHGDRDGVKALDAIMRSNLVNFDNPEASRIIDKVAIERHNCAPNCEELATNLEAMITEWVDVSGGPEISDGDGAEARCESVINPLVVEVGGNNNGTGLTRRQAFDQEVFNVMALSRCANCHNTGRRPFHSSANANTSYAAWDSSELADFNNVDNSFILQKIAGGHQGFNGNSEEYGDMRAAIIAWRDAIDPNAGMDQSVVTYNREWDSCESVDEAVPSMNSISEGEDEESTPRVSGGIFSIQQARIAGANNTYRIVDDYITNPNTHGIYGANVNGNTAGKLEYDFEVFEEGQYEVVANVAGLNGGSDSLHVAIAPRRQTPADNNATYAEFHFRNNNGSFNDEIVRDRGMGDANRTWMLPPGSYTLTLKERENLARIRTVAVRAVGGEATPVTTNSFKVMEFDIGAKVGAPGAKLVFNLEDYTEEAYKISNVRILNGQFIYVKRLKILINDRYLPSNATYLLVDHLVTTMDDQISPSAMTMLKINGPEDTVKTDPDTGEPVLGDDGEPEIIPGDKLSVEFEVLVLTDEKRD